MPSQDMMMQLLLEMLLGGDSPGINTDEQRGLEWITSPEWGMMSGGFDFGSAAPPTFEPRPFEPQTFELDAFANSSDPAYQEIAQRIRGGEPLSAITASIREELANQGVPREVVSDVVKDVERAHKEHHDAMRQARDHEQQERQRVEEAQREWREQQPWHQAGLPNPLDQYRPEDFNPMAEELARRVQTAQGAHDQALRRHPGSLENLFRMRAGGAPGAAGGPTSVEQPDSGLLSRLDGIPAQMTAGLEEAMPTTLPTGSAAVGMAGLQPMLESVFGKVGASVPPMFGSGGDPRRVPEFSGAATTDDQRSMLDRITSVTGARQADPGRDAIRATLEQAWGDDGVRDRRLASAKKRHQRWVERSEALAPTAKDLLRARSREAHAQARARGTAAGLQEAGRNPFVDALAARLGVRV